MAESDLISQDAVDLIVDEEVSGKEIYERRYRHPEWPGGESGVTIGIGYDVGYASTKELTNDWRGKIPDDMISVLMTCIGLTSGEASRILPSVRGKVDVPWDAAMSVFLYHDVPKWYGICRSKLPNFEELSQDCRGALVSLAYNRGPSFDSKGDRYREMRNIKALMASKDFHAIPAQFRSMKRLWAKQSMRGLVARREHEAVLFEHGLGAT